jgi:hypothetical protein
LSLKRAADGADFWSVVVATGKEFRFAASIDSGQSIKQGLNVRFPKRRTHHLGPMRTWRESS